MPITDYVLFVMSILLRVTIVNEGTTMTSLPEFSLSRVEHKGDPYAQDPTLSDYNHQEEYNQLSYLRCGLVKWSVNQQVFSLFNG